MRNKKGEISLLSNEGVKIIAAIFVIFILVLVLKNLFFGITSSKGLDQAVSTLDQISQIIRDLPENVSQAYIVQSPASWNLVYFSGNEKPTSCEGNNCLCICGRNWMKAYDVDSCNGEEGICKIMNYNFEFETNNYLNFNNLPREIEINKTKESITIEYTEKDSLSDNSASEVLKGPKI